MITKKDIQDAYLNKNRKRNQLLYEFYKEEYFLKKYTADFIAAKLTEELGIPFNANMIHLGRVDY